MCVVTRRWYRYNGSAGGQHNQLNYSFVNQFPNDCLATACNICAIKGIYSENCGGGTVTYGTNPKALVSDPQLDSYITDALACCCAQPSGPGQMRYVYVKTFV